MVNLRIKKNNVYLQKGQKDYDYFKNHYLIKNEKETRVEYTNYKTKTKKFKTVETPRKLYNEYKLYITFPRGILDLIPENEYNIIEEDISDELVEPDLSDEEIKHTLDTFNLRDDQVLAVQKCLKAKRGIIQLPTATGKSAIIASVVKRLVEYNPDIKVLALAPTLSTVENIHNTFIENGIDSSIYGHPDKEIKSTVTSSLVQSLVTKENDPDLLEGIQAVFYDECVTGSSWILLPDGKRKPMDYVYENDNITEVLSYDTKTNKYVVKPIVRKIRSKLKDDEEFLRVCYKSKSTGLETHLQCTGNHKIWTMEIDYENKIKRFGYKQAQDLTDNDYIYIDYNQVRQNDNIDNTSGYTKVTKVVSNGRKKQSQYKYNLEIADTHCYFANTVLVSNCHHLKCDTWRTLNKMLPNVQYALGFSARSVDPKYVYCNDFSELDYDTSLIVGSSGKVLMNMDSSYYIEKGIIALPVVIRVNHQVTLPQKFDETNWGELQDIGLMSDSRTDKVIRVASIFNKYNRKTLILVPEKDYAFKIARGLASNDITSFGISFGAEQGYRFKGYKPTLISSDSDEPEIEYKFVNSLDVVKQLSEGEINILIATSHLDEGVDISSLDACVLASGGKKDRKLIQRVGRVLRKSKTGKYAYIVDFSDTGSRVLSKHSNMRMDIYAEDIGVPQESIYDGIAIESFENKFKELEEIN